jgi:hypothetical protein
MNLICLFEYHDHLKKNNMLDTLEDSLRYSALFILILKVGIWAFALTKQKYLSSYPTKWFTVWIGCCASLALIEWVLVEYIFHDSFPYYTTHIMPFTKANNVDHMTFLNPIHYFVRFAFIGLFFRDLAKDKNWKTFFGYAILGLIMFELAQVFIFKSYQGYDSVSPTVKNIFVLAGSGLMLYRIYIHPNISVTLHKNLYFWIFMGLFLPSLAEVFLEFIFTKLYETDTISFYKWYLVRNASQILALILIMVGIWQYKFLRFLPKEY